MRNSKFEIRNEGGFSPEAKIVKKEWFLLIM